MSTEFSKPCLYEPMTPARRREIRELLTRMKACAVMCEPPDAVLAAVKVAEEALAAAEIAHAAYCAVVRMMDERKAILLSALGRAEKAEALAEECAGRAEESALGASPTTLGASPTTLGATRYVAWASVRCRIVSVSTALTVVVKILSCSGQWEELEVEDHSVQDGRVRLPVVMVRDGDFLVEFSREAATGSWRAWVPGAAVSCHANGCNVW